ncbi:MAG: DNA mismatch repair endonuclease MutL [Candidatus Melainabacteria bacterium]|nr:MAG: DNA mismatch repair endonuclease MutL [Candidatus Melainabacteria bacterium]
MFYNVPARLKFLKNPKTEFSYIQEIVQQIALSNPDVSIILTNDNKTALKTLGSSDLLSTISELYSVNIADNLLEVKNKDIFTKMSLDGFISKPTFERSSKKSINVFVNKRPIKCQVFSKALDLVYKNRLPKGKYPFVVLNLTVNPNDIDVNVHPTKKEVRYSDPNKIFSFIFQTLNRVLENANYMEQDNVVLNINAKYKQDLDEDDVIVTEKQIQDNAKITFL